MKGPAPAVNPATAGPLSTSFPPPTTLPTFRPAANTRFPAFRPRSIPGAPSTATSPNTARRVAAKRRPKARSGRSVTLARYSPFGARTARTSSAKPVVATCRGIAAPL